MKPVHRKQTEEKAGPYKEKTLPITWKGWDMVDTMHIQFLDVVFTENFGPVKKADYFDAISFDMNGGAIFTYDKEGNTIHKIKVRITAVA